MNKEEIEELEIEIQKIEEKFYKELVEMSPLKGRDMHNRPPLKEEIDTTNTFIEKFLSNFPHKSQVIESFKKDGSDTWNFTPYFIKKLKSSLQEQEDRIKQEMKEKIEKGIGVLMSSSKVEEYEKDRMFDAGKGCGLNFGISILKKLLKELNI